MKVEASEITINGVEYVPKSEIKNTEQPSGDYVVVRTCNAGVHAGYIEEREGQEVLLKNARRLWYWKGAATLSQVAGSGITNPDACKFPAAIAEIQLIDAIEIIPCTDKAKSIIEGVKEWVES